MKFSYRFPVVRGTQAGREYYIGNGSTQYVGKDISGR